MDRIWGVGREVRWVRGGGLRGVRVGVVAERASGVFLLLVVVVVGVVGGRGVGDGDGEKGRLKGEVRGVL